MGTAKTVLKTFLVALAYGIIACNDSSNDKNVSDNIHREVLMMMDSVSKDLHEHGPIQWLKYFEDTSAFYMASEGKIVFENFEAAQKFINDTLTLQLSAISLQWKEVHVDSLDGKTAAINTYYHEDLTLTNDSIIHENGYCTAIADLTNSGWKFRSLHWSVSK